MILASGSPRRIQLLEEAGFSCIIRPADIDETRLEGEAPLDLVLRLAKAKAQESYSHLSNEEKQDHTMLLAADTIVWIDQHILGKPHTKQDAKAMMELLGGKTHHVTTGACIMAWNKDEDCPTIHSFTDTADVQFYPLDNELIDAYINTCEPYDKAGGYGIQGKARMLVKTISGDYYNIVGLPIARCVREMQAMKNELQDEISKDKISNSLLIRSLKG